MPRGGAVGSSESRYARGMGTGDGGSGAALGALAAILLAGCSPSPEVRLCPPLVVSSSAGPATYGRIAGRGEVLAPGSCASVYVGGRRAALSFVQPDHSLALEFFVQADLRGQTVELRLDRITGDGSEHRYPLVLASRSEAEIAFEPGSTPLAWLPAQVEFRGWLEPVTGAPTQDTWLVNWSRAAVEPVVPTPRLDVPFVARVAGQPGDCVSPVSLHRGSGTGGCWWPQGDLSCPWFHAECDPSAGPCPAGAECRRRRGCTILDVDERWAEVDPPTTDRVIPTGPLDPIDAGAEDGGDADADEGGVI